MPTQEERQARWELERAGFRGASQFATNVSWSLSSDNSLDDFVREAVLQHPAVRAAYWQWAAAVEEITLARSLPDPQLNFEADVANILMTFMPGLMQEWPGPGKRRAAAAMASAESKIQFLLFQEAVLRTAWEIHAVCHRIHAIEQELSARRHEFELLQEAGAVARLQATANQLAWEEVYAWQRECTQVAFEIRNLEDRRIALRTQWKTALGLAPDQPDPPVPARIQVTPLDFNAELLWQRALAQNPGLRRRAAEVRKAAAEQALSARAGLPDFSLGLMADVRSAPWMWRPLAGMRLPVWQDKLAAVRARSQARKEAASAAWQEEQLRLVAQVAEKISLYRELTRNLQLLRDHLVPEAERVWELAQARYRSGQLDYREMVNAVRRRLNLIAQAAQVQTQREIMVSELVLVIAGFLPAPWADGELNALETIGFESGWPPTQKGSPPSERVSFRPSISEEWAVP
ncbi:MAG: TolC family protein [Verrucomicrobiota bacterium]|nr:TolC family protein [Limisphaera sp.]MDW8381718.1 TolC family protein [Verrucomicrobiota bacterium]